MNQDDILKVIRRNRSPYYLRRQLTQTVRQVEVVQTAVAATDEALAPLGTELSAYSTEFASEPVGWSWLNQGTSTVTFSQSRAVITPQAGGAGTNALRCYLPDTFPPPPWTVRIRFANYSTVAGDGGGFVVYRTANARMHTPNIYSRVSNSTGTLFSEIWAVNDWSNFGTINATRYGPSNENERARDRFLQMRCDGTSLYFDYSPDNSQFINVQSTTLATYLGGTGTDLRVGIVGNCPNATATGLVGYDWFRVYGNANLSQG